MIRKDGRPFVLDFGIAREVQESMTRVTGKMSSGTLMYMSPEQLSGAPPSPAQDVYSFAVMVYECLNGTPPFVRGQIKHQILNTPPPPLPSGIASWLSSATMCGLAKKSNERPSTCCEIFGISASRVPLYSNNVHGGAASSATQQAIQAYKEEEFAKAFSLAQNADKSNAEIQFIIGWCYRYGQGVEANSKVATKWLRKAAEQGNSDAQYEYGKSLAVLFDDRLRKTEEREGVDWLRKASNDGYAEAQYYLGYYLLWYHDTREDISDSISVEGIRWLRQAAEQDHVKAQELLAYSYWAGDGVEANDTEAAKWYRAAAEQGSAEAQYGLGRCYEQGRGVDVNLDRARRWYFKAADQGYKYAQYKIGCLYLYGEGISQDDREAMKWFRKAAGQGDANAKYNVGWMYEHGRGVVRDDVEAVKWYRSAADQGDSEAQCSLGVMCHAGSGIEHNDDEAMKWFRMSAEQGNARAQCCIGWMCENGFGIVKNDSEAVKWYVKAAEQGQSDALDNLVAMAEHGCVDAQLWMGVIYGNGMGVEKNYFEAAKWYHKAAERGNAMAQYNLGVMYAHGMGVEGGVSVAVEWYRKAAEQGHEKANEALKQTEDILKNDQVFKDVMKKYLSGGYGGDKRHGAQRALKEIGEKTQRESSSPKTSDCKTLVLPSGVQLEMIYVAPGSFLMGSPESEELRATGEVPHRVTITKGFWLGKYPVTQEQWECVMGGNPSRPKGVKLPVNYVSWNDCQEFIKRLNHLTGCQTRLPTEAEWEYACRAGTRTMFHWGNVFDGSQASCRGLYGPSNRVCDVPKEPTPVDKYAPNSWGFYDMSGNVGEWCADWYAEYNGDAMDPIGPRWGEDKVFRGGCLEYDKSLCRSSSRDNLPPDRRDFAIGFRLCCTADYTT